MYVRSITDTLDTTNKQIYFHQALVFQYRNKRKKLSILFLFVSLYMY